MFVLKTMMMICHIVMEMFIHHEGRYMKYIARETDMKQRYIQEASKLKVRTPNTNLHEQQCGICHILIYALLFLKLAFTAQCN